MEVIMNRDAMKTSNGPSAEVLNALMAQKETILLTLNLATDADDFSRVYRDLQLVADLWKALGYGSKIKEICNHAVNRCYFFKQEVRDVLSAGRANMKGRASWEREASRLDSLITDFRIMWS